MASPLQHILKNLMKFILYGAVVTLLLPAPMAKLMRPVRISPSAVASCAPLPKTQPSATKWTVNSNLAGDTDFINTAGQANLAEILAGRVAAKKAGREAIRDFAQSMVADHLQAQDDLTRIAQQEGVSIPRRPDTEHQRTNAQLDSLSGRKFDSAYMNYQLMDHEVAIQLFETETREGKDSLCRAYAARYLPKLRHHYEMAKPLRIK
jgi:putative membrane protein